MNNLFIIFLVFFTVVYAKSASSSQNERVFDMKYVQNVGEDEEIIADNMAVFDFSTMGELLDLPVPSSTNEKQTYIQQSLLKPEGM